VYSSFADFLITLTYPVVVLAEERPLHALATKHLHLYYVIEKKNPLFSGWLSEQECVDLDKKKGSEQ